MNKILFILIVCFAAQAMAGDDHDKKPEKDRCCDDPCRGECGCKKPRSIYYTDKLPQEVNEVTWLTCTPDSYFEKIKYEGCYKLNTTCFGLIHEKTHHERNIYTGITKKGRHVKIDGRPLKTTWTWTNGNAQRLEEAKLHGCQECENKHGHLYTFAQWVADEPIEGCCEKDCDDRGVKTLTGVAYELKIFGRCCSTCSLQSSVIELSKRLSNDVRHH